MTFLTGPAKQVLLSLKQSDTMAIKTINVLCMCFNL